MSNMVRHDLKNMSIRVPSDLKATSQPGNFVRTKSRIKKPGVFAVGISDYSEMDQVVHEVMRSAINSPKPSNHPTKWNKNIRCGDCVYGEWKGVESLDSSVDKITGHVTHLYNACLKGHGRTVLIFISGNEGASEDFDETCHNIICSITPD